jgi:adenylate kinase family enzyme
MKLLYIVRGIPGSGKTTIAQKVCQKVFEADHYFYSFDLDLKKVVYKFDPTKISAAHRQCQKNVENSMKDGVLEIAVSNTFTQKWEVAPYIELARKYDYNVQIITVQSNFKNVHDVPEESIQRMKKRWENFTLEDFE